MFISIGKKNQKLVQIINYVKNMRICAVIKQVPNKSARVSLLIKLQAEASSFIEEETLAQMLSGFCKILKYTFFNRTLLDIWL